MRIAELHAYVVNLPLRREFKHASFTRRASENLVVRCRLADGTVGWGEGVPREYVTGETPDGAIEEFAAAPLDEAFSHDAGDWPDVIAMCEAFNPSAMCDDPRGAYGNALRCAVELSVLDAFGRLLGQPVSEVTRHFEPSRGFAVHRDRVRYSTTITAVGARKERMSALKMRVYGFRQCKVKVGVAGVDDFVRLRRLRRWLGGGMDIRLDANEAWSASEAAAKIESLAECDITCVEQPVPHAEVKSLTGLRRRVATPIMLDESLTSLIDAEAAIREQTCDLFNIRLSKCGGFLNSLRLAAIAREAGLGYQLGCHPGESGLLSAAGRHWAVAVPDIRYLEGSYDRHLLRDLLTNEDVTFRYGGCARALAGPGLGVTVDLKALNRMKGHEVTRRMG
ncbi:MAG: dipeptide epimerase [Planctomycetes bacterium]|nr:dipeptide epimerase [Planctomycetota bacterium]